MPSYPVSSGLRGGDGTTRSHGHKPDVPQSEEVYSIKEIQRHFWPEGEDEDPRPLEAGRKGGKTMHGSAATPEKLAYVLLFKDANPRWESDGIIFTKTSLELLPADIQNGHDRASLPIESSDGSNDPEAPDRATETTEERPSEENRQDKETRATSTTSTITTSPKPKPNLVSHRIAIFTQLGRTPYDSDTTRTFTFAGYHTITHVAILEPRSQELARMLEQKWTRTNSRTGHSQYRQREGDKWQESFDRRWAVVKFQEVEEEGQKLVIERIEEEETEGRERKGVNELLREMRLKNGGKGNTGGKNDAKTDGEAREGDD